MPYKTNKAMLTERAFKRAPNYIGPDRSDWIVALIAHRDSNLIDRCNFAAMLDLLGGEDGTIVRVERDGHWACGWIETIFVSKTAPAKVLTTLRKTLNALEEYPIIDEDSYSELELEEQEATLEANLAQFCREISKALGRELITQDDVAQSVDLAHAVYMEDCGYRGTEDAWVSDRSIKRYLESYEGQGDQSPLVAELRIALKAVTS